MARPEGFEPPTPRFVVWCSIQLSYGRLLPPPGEPGDAGTAALLSVRPAIGKASAGIGRCPAVRVLAAAAGRAETAGAPDWRDGAIATEARPGRAHASPRRA